MAAGTVHYNLEHVQVMSLVGTGNDWLAVGGPVNISPSVTANITRFQAAGRQMYPVADAPEGSFGYEFAESDFAVLAIINGGDVSTSGTGPAAIERYEQPARAVSAPFALSGLASNINGAAPEAAFRLTIPNAIAGPASITMSQQTHGTWTGDGAMQGDDNDVMVIYEKLATKPTFTNGVMPVNLERPTP